MEVLFTVWSLVLFPLFPSLAVLLSAVLNLQFVRILLQNKIKTYDLYYQTEQTV